MALEYDNALPLLKEYNADLNIESINGITPLQIAIALNNEVTLRMRFVIMNKEISILFFLCFHFERIERHSHFQVTFGRF